MRSYRNRGSVRSTTWRIELFDMGETRYAARSLLSGGSVWPE
ncbi:hypothetical protein [Streptomyces sp. NPDC055749]